MSWLSIPFTMRLLPLFTRSFLVGCILMCSCSSPSTTKQNPPDPAADSVADGLIPTSDTTVVDDDTLETNARAPRRNK